MPIKKRVSKKKTPIFLRYSLDTAYQSTVKRRYRAWRKKNGISERCDIKGCQFNIGPLEWVDDSLIPIMDHINGNRKDNFPFNLRLVCPNCNSQLPTTGGRNKGRIFNTTPYSFEYKNSDGDHVTVVVPTGEDEFSFIMEEDDKETWETVVSNRYLD